MVRTPTFQDTGEEFAVTRGDLYGDQITLKPFSVGFCPEPCQRAHVLSQCLKGPRPVLPSPPELVGLPPLLDQRYAPACIAYDDN